ncbi:MAG: glycosyltransferase, partial [bacterium]|nr:glycosyltransferase [bacterium]
MLRLVTAVSSYPFYNFRYLKLLSEFSRYFSVYVFSSSKSRDKRIREGDEFYRLYHLLPFKIPRRIQYYLEGVCRQTAINFVRPDIVWIFDTSGPLMPLMIDKPIVLDIDDPIFNRRNIFSQLKDTYLLKNKRVKKIVVPTKMIKDRFVEIYGIDEDKVEIIPNGVDIGIFTPSGIPEEDVVYYHGTLAPHRSRFLVKVIEEVLKHRKAKFILIGDVPRWFRDYITKKGFTDYIVCPGFIEHDHLPEWLSKAKVCIFTQDVSLGGRFPSKLLEYMASGRPIVATDVDESWPVRESGAGIISPIDPKIFAAKIIQLLEDNKLA